MITIAFVVLHYEDIDSTNKCLNSLKKYLNNKMFNVQIIVVDNGSPNNKLSHKYTFFNQKNVYLLSSKENLGFAQGNNIGYRFAKFRLKADIIILCNNDLIFKQKDFVEKLVKHYGDFDVAGPQVITGEQHINKNPIYKINRTISDVNKILLKYDFLKFLWLFNVDDIFMKSIALQRSKKNEKEISTSVSYRLYGACLIFSDEYIKKFDGLFPGTFMYGEEDILWYFVNKNSLRMKYYDDLIVFHEGQASTTLTTKSDRKARFFYYKNARNSFAELKKIMLKNQKDFK